MEKLPHLLQQPIRVKKSSINATNEKLCHNARETYLNLCFSIHQILFQFRNRFDVHECLKKNLVCEVKKKWKVRIVLNIYSINSEYFPRIFRSNELLSMKFLSSLRTIYKGALCSFHHRRPRRSWSQNFSILNHWFAVLPWSLGNISK